MPPLSTSVHELIRFLNGEIAAEVHTAYITLHRLMVYFRYFRTKMTNAEAYLGP